MRPNDYLPITTPALNVRIVERAHDDLGEGEDIGPHGEGTNRSVYCDALAKRFGSPLGSYWCALAVSSWWTDAGAMLPPEPGSCESWRQWAFQTARFREAPSPGYAVLYGAPDHASHIGIIARLVNDPTALHGHRVVTIEGNASLGAYSRDGWIVAERTMNGDAVIGFVAPTIGEQS
jgi:hypothetical protein